MEAILEYVREVGSQRGPEIIQRLEGLTTPEEYDALLFQVCREREFTAEEIDQIDHANTYATTNMHGHMRKDGITPTSTHFKRVAIIIAAVGGDVFNIQHGLLHDIIEDTKDDKYWTISNHPVITAEAVAQEFGAPMARAVQSVSKAKSRYLRKVNGDGQGQEEESGIIEANLPIMTHYRLFEALDNYRVVITKLADRLDYFLTLNESIKKGSMGRKAFETLELYVPLADRLRMHWLREELTRRALSVYAQKKAAILEANTLDLYPRSELDLIEYEIGQEFDKSPHSEKPDVYAFTPSWWHALREFGSKLEDVDATSTVPPLVNIAIPMAASEHNENRLLSAVRPWWDVLHKRFRFPPGAWGQFKTAVREGGIGEIPTMVRGRVVMVRFATYEQFARDLTPVVNPFRREMQDSNALREFSMLHENFVQLHAIWPADVASGSNHNLGKIVREIIGHLHKPLVRVYGNDGKPAIFPRGATLFDAACYFGTTVARLVHTVHVKREDRYAGLPLSAPLKDGDKILMVEVPSRDNFVPAALSWATTNLARETIQKALLTKVASERMATRSKDRVITNELVGRGVTAIKLLYERRNLLHASSRRLPRHLRPIFSNKEDRKLQRLLKDMNHPSYESFMIAVALNRLNSKRKQRLLVEIADHLIAVRNAA